MPLVQFCNVGHVWARTLSTSSKGLGIAAVKSKGFDGGNIPQKIGGKVLVSMIPGAGHGLELTECLRDLLSCSGAPVDFEWLKENMEQDEDYNNMILSVRRNRLAIKGLLDPDIDKLSPDQHDYAKSMRLRRELDLFAFVAECKSFPGLVDKMKVHKSVDVTVFRQNSEGDHMLLEYSPLSNIVEHIQVITAYNTERLAEKAFRYAKSKRRKVVQCLHKFGSLPISDNVFVQGFQTVAERYYPQVKSEIRELGPALDDFLADHTYLDVVVTDSMDGIVITSLLLGILGSPSLAAGRNVGEDIIIFEPADKIKDISQEKNTSNPTAFFLCGASVLEQIGHEKHAEGIREALNEVFTEGVLTRDLGGTATTEEFTRAVIKQIKLKFPGVLCSRDPPLRLPPKPLPGDMSPIRHSTCTPDSTTPCLPVAPPKKTK